jgi:hypothetical protein
MSNKSKMHHLNSTNNGRSSSPDQSQTAEVALADPSLRINSERSNMTNNARATSDLISQTNITDTLSRTQHLQLQRHPNPCCANLTLMPMGSLHNCEQPFKNVIVKARPSFLRPRGKSILLMPIGRHQATLSIHIIPAKVVLPAFHSMIILRQFCQKTRP